MHIVARWAVGSDLSGSLLNSPNDCGGYPGSRSRSSPVRIVAGGKSSEWSVLNSVDRAASPNPSAERRAAVEGGLNLGDLGMNELDRGGFFPGGVTL
jgi:hypothetical protein